LQGTLTQLTTTVASKASTADLTAALEKLKTHIVNTELSYYVKKATLIDEITSRCEPIASLISKVIPQLAIT